MPAPVLSILMAERKSVTPLLQINARLKRQEPAFLSALAFFTVKYNYLSESSSGIGINLARTSFSMLGATKSTKESPFSSNFSR